jgi:CBS-domain-containing membrane protein
MSVENREASSLYQLFMKTTLEELLNFKPGYAPKELVSINTTSTVAECVRVMFDRNITSIPVMDAEVANHCVAVVDIKDVCRALLNKLEEIEEWGYWPEVKFSEFLEETSISSVIDFAHGDPLVASSGSASVFSIMKFFSSGLSHRAVILLSDKHTYSVVSQTDVISWLASYMVRNEELRNQLFSIPLLSELHNRSSESHEVVKAVWTESVYNILKLMERELVQAVALVDEEGRLQGNFSASDLIHLEKALVSDLKLSAKDYLEKFSRTSLNPLAVLEKEKDLSMRSSLAEVLVLFSSMGMHRIWLLDSPVDAKFSPSGVITSTDVLQLVFRQLLKSI